MEVKGNAPLNKVAVQTAATALTALLVFILQRAFGLDLPLDVQAAMSVLVSVVVGFAAAYYTPIAVGELKITPEHLED